MCASWWRGPEALSPVQLSPGSSLQTSVSGLGHAGLSPLVLGTAWPPSPSWPPPSSSPSCSPPWSTPGSTVRLMTAQSGTGSAASSRAQAQTWRVISHQLGVSLGRPPVSATGSLTPVSCWCGRRGARRLCTWPPWDWSPSAGAPWCSPDSASALCRPPQSSTSPLSTLSSPRLCLLAGKKS